MAKNGMQYALTKKDNGFGATKLVENIQHSNLSFSFLYYRQINNFEVGSCNKQWFISLLIRLHQLSGIESNTFHNEYEGNKTIRYHAIDWNAKNIPLRRTDLDWLPKEIRENEDSFPMMQLSVSTGTGRIIGFFGVGNEASVFHIVLLDPNHNLQPSQKHNYQIRKTTKGESQYDCLLEKLINARLIAKKCYANCSLLTHLEDMNKLHDHIIYFSLDDDFFATYLKIINNYNIAEVIEAGILYLSK